MRSPGLREARGRGAGAAEAWGSWAGCRRGDSLGIVGPVPHRAPTPGGGFAVMGDSRGEVVGEGRFLRLVRRDGWEYVERTGPIRAVFIAAVTDDGRLLLTLEHRVPVDAAVVGFPAG